MIARQATRNAKKNPEKNKKQPPKGGVALK
jgi:hypothetical protein